VSAAAMAEGRDVSFNFLSASLANDIFFFLCPDPAFAAKAYLRINKLC
jgi:hypothetical protein